MLIYRLILKIFIALTRNLTKSRSIKRILQKRKSVFAIDLLHDDVTRPKGSMVVVVTLKPKMAAGTSNGGNSKSTGSMICVAINAVSFGYILFLHDAVYSEAGEV